MKLLLPILILMMCISGCEQQPKEHEHIYGDPVINADGFIRNFCKICKEYIVVGKDGEKYKAFFEWSESIE